jgi:enoyl-CoA hydratase/carnithine racemase
MLVEVSEEGGVAEVVLDRPEALNAISTALALQLAEACRRLAGRRSVVAIVLSSATERAFSVGADLKERARMDQAALLSQRPAIRAMFSSVRSLEAPLLAAVAGYALGGGFELALSCDLIVADETAEVGLPEVGVGLVPGGGGTQLVARRAGPGAAADLVFSGRRVLAAEALRLGLVDRVVPAGQAREAAVGLARAIASHSPLALRAAKRALRLGAGADLAAALEVEDSAWREAASSPDGAEGIAAFVEKRPPKWPSAQP